MTKDITNKKNASETPLQTRDKVKGDMRISDKMKQDMRISGLDPTSYWPIVVPEDKVKGDMRISGRKTLMPTGKVELPSWEVIDKTVKQRASRDAIGRSLLYARYGNEDLTEQMITWLKSGTLGASIVMELEGNEKKDILETTPKHARIPVIRSDFTIGARSNGGGAGLVGASTAGKVVANAEDNLIFNGAPKFGVAGLRESAGLIETTSLDFGTPGNATEKVVSAIGMANDVGIMPATGWNLLLPSEQWVELMKSRISGQNREVVDVREMLGPNGNVIGLPSNLMPAGTGILIPADTEGFVELYVGLDLTTVAEEDKFGGIDVTVLEAVTVMPIVEEAIVALANI